MSENLFQPTQAAPNDWVTALFGPPGGGKTLSLVAIKDTVQHHDLEIRVVGVTPGLTRQYQRTVLGQSTARTASQYEVEEPRPGAYEALRLREARDGLTHLIEAWAGEDRHIGGATDLGALIDRLRSRSVRRLVLCTNPFRDEPRLAEWAIFEFPWWLQENSFDLTRAVIEAAKRLWGVSEKGLAKLYHPWPRLAKDMAGARLVRAPLARFGRPIAESFRIEGVSAERAAAIVTGLCRVAKIVAALAEPDVRLTRELARAWPDTFVLVTHAGYLAYLPGLGQGDLREYGCSLYPNPDAARMSQVIVQESLNLTLGGDPEDGGFIEGPRPEAHELLAAIRRPPVAVPVAPRSFPAPAARRSGVRLPAAAWEWVAIGGLVVLGGVLLWAAPLAAVIVFLALLLMWVGYSVGGVVRPTAPPAALPRPRAEVPAAIARRRRPADIAPNGQATTGIKE